MQQQLQATLAELNIFISRVVYSNALGALLPQLIAIVQYENSQTKKIPTSKVCKGSLEYGVDRYSHHCPTYDLFTTFQTISKHILRPTPPITAEI